MSLTDRRDGRAGRDPAPAPTPPSPRATRHRVSSWRDPRLLVGVVLVAGSALAGALLLTDDASVAVWAVRSDVAAGEPVAAADLVPREVRFTSQADADRYLPADGAAPAGATVARDVGAGELLPRSVLVVGRPVALVEVPLPVAGEAVPATVRPGSVVDVWVTPGDGVVPGPAGGGSGADGGAAPERAVLVLSEVRVVAAPRAGSALGRAAERQVVVGVAEDQQPALAEALASMAAGEVVLVRHP